MFFFLRKQIFSPIHGKIWFFAIIKVLFSLATESCFTKYIKVCVTKHLCSVPIAGNSAKSSTIKLITGGTDILLVQCSKNSARIAKAAPHKLPGISDLSVLSVPCPGYPVCLGGYLTRCVHCRIDPSDLTKLSVTQSVRYVGIELLWQLKTYSLAPNLKIGKVSAVCLN